MRVLALVIFVFILTSCASSERVYYNAMTDQEIALYNVSVEFWDKVYCVKEVRTGSHIKHRFCSTLDELVNQAKQDEGMLYVLNGGDYSVFR